MLPRRTCLTRRLAASPCAACRDIRFPGVTGPVVLGPGAEVVQTLNQELVLLVWNDKEWPDTRGLRIVLTERQAALTDPGCNEQFPGDGLPKWDEQKRVLTFFVAKGRIARLRYASFADKRHIDAFGLPAWGGSGGGQAFVRGMALAGCEWMMTPYRSLVFVHATQQPVCEPEFQVLSPVRAIGDQHARLEARLRMHGPSTGKFEIEATWKEWVDDLEKPGPELIVSKGQLGEVLLTENHVNQFGLAAVVDAQKPAEGSPEPRARGDRHEFGDTKFRLIDYTIRATTRFREYLPEALYAQRDRVTRVGPVAEGPQMQVGADDDPGAPVLRDGTAVARNTLVPASAPPDDPLILYTVPTFRWSRTEGASSTSATRLGNGLRVWLDRPWFSSGNGELLGVVILGENRPFTDIPSALVPLVTQWGLDPLWDTVLPKHRTNINDFPAHVAAEPVKLREFPDDHRPRRWPPRAVGYRPTALVLRHRVESRRQLHAVREAGTRSLPAECAGSTQRSPKSLSQSSRKCCRGAVLSSIGQVPRSVSTSTASSRSTDR